MKFLPILKNHINESIILEFSDKLIQRLIQKFQKETQDSPEVILSYINDFEKFKEGLSQENRNIEKYSYSELKDVVLPKRLKGNLTKYLKFFKKNTEGIPATDMIKTFRKYLELERYIPKQDITKFKYLDLVGFLEKNFEKAMTKILKDKLSRETQFTPDQISYYINSYFNILNEIPLDSKLVADMTGDEFEHFIDGISQLTPDQQSKSGIEDIELIYDENNLKIFAPKTKDQCILLRNGRSWCTSRDGSGNLYYNYRLNNNLTLYYVINEDLPYSDTDFASVILVEPNGNVRLADGTNAGRYSGHQSIPWSDILKKIPKLSGLESLFVPKPLTEEEKRTISIVKNTSVGDDPMKSFNNDKQMVELWLEILSPTLRDEQYKNIPDDLQKKYISLGFPLTYGMIENSSPKVMEYYTARKIESIKTKSLDALTDSDIALLRTPALSKLKDSLKNEFVRKMIESKGDSQKLEVDSFSRGPIGKFIALYGLDELFSSLPKTLTTIKLVNPDNNGLTIEIPDTISEFQNLWQLQLDNCVRKIPDAVCKLDKLNFLTIRNNAELTSIPDCVLDLPCLSFINAQGSSNLTLPSRIKDMDVDDMGGNLYSFDNEERCQSS